jgi:hypothetical protein
VYYERIILMDSEMRIEVSFIHIRALSYSALPTELMCRVCCIDCMLCCVAITRIYALSMNFSI